MWKRERPAMAQWKKILKTDPRWLSGLSYIFPKTQENYPLLSYQKEADWEDRILGAFRERAQRATSYCHQTAQMGTQRVPHGVRSHSNGSRVAQPKGVWWESRSRGMFRNQCPGHGWLRQGKKGRRLTRKAAPRMYKHQVSVIWISFFRSWSWARISRGNFIILESYTVQYNSHNFMWQNLKFHLLKFKI